MKATGQVLLLLMLGILTTGQLQPEPCLQNLTSCQVLMDRAVIAQASRDVIAFCRETAAFLDCLTSDLADCSPQLISTIMTSYLDNVHLSHNATCSQVEKFRCLQNWTVCESLLVGPGLMEPDTYCRAADLYVACIEEDLADCSNETEAAYRSSYLTMVTNSFAAVCSNYSRLNSTGLPLADPVLQHCAAQLSFCLANITGSDISDLTLYCNQLSRAADCISLMLVDCNFPDVHDSLSAQRQLLSTVCVQDSEAQCSLRWAACADPLQAAIVSDSLSSATDYSSLCSILDSSLKCIDTNTVSCLFQTLVESTQAYRAMNNLLCVRELACPAVYPCVKDMNSLLLNISATNDFGPACRGYSQTLQCLEAGFRSCGWQYNSSISYQQLSQLFNQTCDVLLPSFVCSATFNCINTSHLISLEAMYRPSSWCQTMQGAYNCTVMPAAQCMIAANHNVELRETSQAVDQICARVRLSEMWAPPSSPGAMSNPREVQSSILSGTTEFLSWTAAQFTTSTRFPHTKAADLTTQGSARATASNSVPSGPPLCWFLLVVLMLLAIQP